MFVKLLTCFYKETEFNNLLLYYLIVWEKTDRKMPAIKLKFLKSTLWLLHKLLRVLCKWKYGINITDQKLQLFANKKACINVHLKIMSNLRTLKEFYSIVTHFHQISSVNILVKCHHKTVSNVWEKCLNSTDKIFKQLLMYQFNIWLNLGQEIL